MKQFRYKVSGQSIFIQPSDALPFTLVMPAGLARRLTIQQSIALKTSELTKTKPTKFEPTLDIKKA
jgi:hypothetical protein